MEIQYLGHSCFRIKGKDVILVTDPYGTETGLKLKTSADIVTVSHNHFDHNNTSAVSGTTKHPQPFIVSGPGEYEVAGVFIYGLPTFHDKSKGAKRGENTVYVVTLDEIKLIHLGDLGHSLSDEQLEEINEVDVLFVPVGGNYTLNSKEAVGVVNQIESKIVIPMHYQVPGLQMDIAPVGDFLKEVGAEVTPIEKLVVSKDNLPDERQVVVLKMKKEE